jgi:hypothetical protein
MDAQKYLSPTTQAALVTLQNREARAGLTAALKGFAELPAPVAPDTIRRIFTLEDKLYSVIQNDKRWYFSSKDDPEADMFSRDLAVLHVVAAKSLSTLVERRGEWSQTDEDDLLQRVIALALYHHAAAIKWGFFRHEPVKATTWPQLHRLFQLAETLGVAAKPGIFIANAQSETSTITALYARSLLLDLFNTGSLSISQIEIVDGWIAAWAPEYQFDVEYTKETHALLVDLDSIAGLQLVTGTPNQTPYRYLRLTGFAGQLEGVRGDLRAGRPFVGRGMPNAFEMEDHVALLSVIERLNANILQTSARRVEQRTVLADTYAEVRLGFDATFTVVKNKDAKTENTDTPAANLSFGGVTLSLEPKADGAAEADLADDQPQNKKTPWRVHDVTSKGIGIMVERALSDRIQVGSVMALRLKRAEPWMLGSVARKIEHRSAGEALLGIEILSHSPLPLTLSVLDEYGEQLDVPSLNAIYLPGSETNGVNDLIVVSGAGNGLKHVFGAKTGRGMFDLRLNRVHKKGDDWIGLRFDVVSSHEHAEA